jgi:hypothetical protein
MIVPSPPPLMCNGSGGIARLPTCAGGECAADPDAPPPPPRQSSDLSHVVKDGKIRVAKINMASPSLTHRACSLLVLQSAAKPRLRTQQCPLSGGHVIPCRIAIVPPMQACRRDGCQCLSAGPQQSREEGDAHKQSLRTYNTLQSTIFDRSTRGSDGLVEDATAGSNNHNTAKEGNYSNGTVVGQ